MTRIFHSGAELGTASLLSLNSRSIVGVEVDTTFDNPISQFAFIGLEVDIGEISSGPFSVSALC